MREKNTEWNSKHIEVLAPWEPVCKETVVTIDNRARNSKERPADKFRNSLQIFS